MPSEQRNNKGAEDNDELVMSLVEQALSQPASQREVWLHAACDGDAALLRVVSRYIEWDERMKGFLLSPLYSLMAEDSELEPGERLEDRFRIVRRVAAGGMGVVYEAWDEKLGRRIAIKCAKTGFDARLLPEVRHASEINHPNVCRTWEIHTAAGPAGKFDFFTMEFIEGETLAERFRAGPLPDREALRVASQVCAGLAEAHRHQVVHGDLKSNNILLTAGPDGTRAVITDFGLARQWTGSYGSTGLVGGTPDYIAPELLDGDRPSAASDLYALGVILHEIASGRRPAGTELQHRWARTIGRCLEPSPARRFTNASDVAKSLAPFPLMRWMAIAVLALIAIGAGAVGYRTIGIRREVVRLAVMPFAADADSRSLSDGLLEDTTDRLRLVRDDRRKLTVIPAREAVLNKVEGPETAVTRLGATHILTGTFRREPGRVVIHALLTDGRSRLQLREWDGEYQDSELRSVPVALAGMVTGTLRLPPLAASATVNSLAYPDFTTGVGLLERDSVDAALVFLTRSAQADPESPLTYARVAEAQARKYNLNPVPGSLIAAQTALHEAQKRNPDLALVWVVSGRINEFQGRYEAAESDLRRALEIDPRDGDAWRRLGRVYKENDRFAESILAFQRAIEVQPGFYLNYQDLCGVYTEQAEYGAALLQCGKVVELAPDLWYAHFALAVPLFCRGSYAEADAEFLRAIALDPGSATAIFSRAFALTSQGRAEAGIPLFHRALEIGPATHLMYSGLGTAYRLASVPAEARTAYESGLILAEKEIAANPRNAILKAQLAYLCAQLGQRSRAESEASQARELAPASVEVAWWLVQAREALGERDAALAALRTLPDDIVRRLNREADLADFRHSDGFKQIMTERHLQ